MNGKKLGTKPSSREGAGAMHGTRNTAGEIGAGPRPLMHAGRRGMLVMASVIAAFVILGCGKHNGDRVSSGDGASEAVAAVPVEQAGQAAGASSGTNEAAADPQRGALVADSPDSLPPEVAASIADTLVVPGDIVEITAEGSADVEEIALWDGIGKRQSFAYVDSAKLWRVFYRVPMRTSLERVGLSVTARNGLNRWRRVWIFLKVERERGAEQAEPSPQP